MLIGEVHPVLLTSQLGNDTGYKTRVMLANHTSIDLLVEIDLQVIHVYKSTVVADQQEGPWVGQRQERLSFELFDEIQQ